MVLWSSAVVGAAGGIAACEWPGVSRNALGVS